MSQANQARPRSPVDAQEREAPPLATDHARLYEVDGEPDQIRQGAML
jgi:hypothetical protein